MKLSLNLKTSLTQTLTPQQIQYLKLLQLPVIQLEQQMRQEIEQNPMLEESSESELLEENIDDVVAVEDYDDNDDAAESELTEIATESKLKISEYDPFEFQKLFISEDAAYQKPAARNEFSDEDSEPFQIKDTVSFADELLQQLRLVDLTDEEYFLGEQLIGNIDDDGYLRRELEEIVKETNVFITEINLNLQRENEKPDDGIDNPARQYALSAESEKMLLNVYKSNPEIVESVRNLRVKAEIVRKKGNVVKLLNEVTSEQAEKVLAKIRTLDPPGVGSRTVQECLVSQCETFIKPNAAQKLALEILTKTYDAFAKKHYNVITKQLGVTEEYLKEAIEVIRSLNPRPGGGNFQYEMNTVIPDFIISNDEETNELLITINDNTLPALKLSDTYQRMKKEAFFKKTNKETKDWIRGKYEDAKFLIQAIRQRKSTMLKVMTAIAHLQMDFFYEGPSLLKPLIYKNVAEQTGLDISTVCRIVNGKFVQTKFGTYELKYFFSEALPTDDGEEVATKVIKQELKKIIDEEPKNKPFSDDKLSALLKENGFNIARRTVAKYREQLKIPVARLRKEL